MRRLVTSAVCWRDVLVEGALQSRWRRLPTSLLALVLVELAMDSAKYVEDGQRSHRATRDVT